MDTRIELLARRARRFRAGGQLRRAGLVYGELTAADPGSPRWWVLLAETYRMRSLGDDARKALRQALYLLRQRDEPGRHATVSRLLEALTGQDDAVGAPRRSCRGPRRAGAY